MWGGMEWPAGEAELRLAKVLGEMERAEIDELIVYAPALWPANVDYLSAFEPMAGDGAFVLVSARAAPKLLVREVDFERARRDSWITDVEVLERGTWPALASLAGRSAVGLAGCGHMRPGPLGEVIAHLGAAPWNAEDVIERAAACKTPAELDRIMQASRLADLGFDRALQVLHPGISEFEVAAEMEVAMRRQGAVDNFGLLTFGPSNDSMGLPRRRGAEHGDTCIFEITPTVGSKTYSAQLCRTAFIGQPGKEIETAHRLLEEALAEGVAACVPGAPASVIVERLNKVFESAGYGEYCRPPYMRARGHGFGTGRINLSEEWTERLLPNMTFIIHPNQYVPDVGYLALGQMVRVTDTGCEVLSHSGTHLAIVDK